MNSDGVKGVSEGYIRISHCHDAGLEGVIMKHTHDGEEEASFLEPMQMGFGLAALCIQPSSHLPKLN